MRASIYNTESTPTAPRTVRGVALTGDTPANYYSSLFDIGGSDGFAASFRATGDLTGAWTLWRTNLENPDLTDDGDWDEETDFAPTDPAGSAAQFSVEVNGARSRLWRAKFAYTSGTGTITCDVTADPGGR